MFPTFLGETRLRPSSDASVDGGFVHVDGREWYEIRHCDRLAPFFMSLVSSSDLWWFVASTGGMTAGRRDADHAFLPYETEDKLTSGIAHTGPLTILRVHDADRVHLWEPLSTVLPRVHRIERRLRKSVEGDALAFEESNLDLGLTFVATLSFGERVGFVRTVELRDDTGHARRVDVLDGYRNVLPHGTTKALQNRFSCLLDAYKRNELDPATGVATYSLSSILTDRVEASEALRANVIWSLGLDPTHVLLTPDARLEAFRHGDEVRGDHDVRGQRGAYLAIAPLTIEAGGARRWHVIADVSCDARAVGRIRVWQRDLAPDAREALVLDDVARTTEGLRDIVGRADGLSVGGDRLTTAHHFANTLFNVMRGGVFVDGHHARARDFDAFVAVRNRAVHARHAAWLAELPEKLSISSLIARAEKTEDPDLVRLTLEYLPITFSRRHGDPSRPWNEFAIRLRNPDGSPRTDYQGNWRDIFQNWEPLAYAYPAFAFSMVAKFLNATTPDGYNPYRVTRDGIEWEVPEPEDPWANIGYWGDHQIVYLQKLLEAVERLEPGRLLGEWNRRIFSSADVPYRIVPHREMVEDHANTIRFDDDAHRRAMERVARLGTDGRLVPAASGEGSSVELVTMVEKLLVLLLAKLTNLVPGGGIWMNTQRPEWNDANNALVGKGVSVVTAAYLRRFLAFWRAQLDAAPAGSFAVADVVVRHAREVIAILRAHRPSTERALDDRQRRTVMDALGEAATTFRAARYEGVATTSAELDADTLKELLDLALSHVDHALASNRRADGLFHAYLLLRLEDDAARLEPLTLMLEGQVAALSSGFLSTEASIALLNALRASPLYWPEQRTYLLYPNRALPGFLEKNSFDAQRLDGSALAKALAANEDDRLVLVDPFDRRGHFGGDLRNADDLRALLDELGRDPRYASLVAAERASYLALFEEVFDHHAFTGRSGTFFAYEGLGSVYWHMVSKLLLAVQERLFAAVDEGAPADRIDALRAAYEDVRSGIGFRKSPALYGAFPTDPYSHTPETGGARQPGMTGQVKEELLTRLGELGLRIERGAVRVDATLLHDDERVAAPTELAYLDVTGARCTVPVPAGGIAFTLAQTPVIVEPSAGVERSRERRALLRVGFADGTERELEDELPASIARHVFDRDGAIRWIRVSLGTSSSGRA